ncbi:MAG: hypothetical protein WC495_04735 [Patescibacteria group bacterium]
MPAIEELANMPRLPKDENSFGTYYDPLEEHNPFWKRIHNVIEALEPAEELPERLATLHAALVSFCNLEIDERAMADVVAELLKTTAVIEGVVDVFVTFGSDTYDTRQHWRSVKDALSSRTPREDVERVKRDLGDPLKLIAVDVNKDSNLELFGHRTFSYGLSEAREKRYPAWVDQKWNPANLLFGWLRKALIDSFNDRMRKGAYSDMVITQSPEIIVDLRRAIAGLVANSPEIGEELMMRNRITRLTVQFSYGSFGDYTGLQIQILDAHFVPYQESTDSDAHPFESPFTPFEGYSRLLQEKIGEIKTKMSGILTRLREEQESSQLRFNLQKIDRMLFTQPLKVGSPSTDQAHRWIALSNLYHSQDAEPVYLAMCDFQSFVHEHLRTLYEMVKILNLCVRKAKQLKAPLTFPTILPDGENILKFESLYPMHLGHALEGKGVVPITGLPGINGDMIALTGAHGGGKTVAEHTISGNIYLAQSGLPILGKSFKLNCRTHLGLVFIEGASGVSVCQLLITKITQVFEGIEGVVGNNCIVILDELGSATQQAEGERIALRVLEELYNRQVSILFSTQILGVAEEAERLFGARCFKVDRNHRLSPGIAGGNLDAIVRDAGLDRYLGN